MDWFPLYNSLRIAFFATVIVFFTGIFAAHRICRLPRWVKGVLDVFLTLPLVLPPTVVGYFLLCIFGTKRPVGKWLLETFQFKIPMEWYGGILAAAVVSFPLMYRAVRGAMESMDKQLLYAARTLGASEKKIFFRIILPNCRSGLLAGMILAFARAMGEFGATIMIAGNIPGKTQTMALAVYTAVQSGNRQTAYLWSLVIVILSALAIVGINYFEKKKYQGEDEGF